MSASSESPSRLPTPGRSPSLFKRFGVGDPVLGAFSLVTFGLLVFCVVGYLLLVSGLLPDSLRLILTALGCLVCISFLLGALWLTNRLKPWWTSIFPDLFLVSVTVYLISVLLGMPLDTPLPQYSYVTGAFFLNLVAISGLLSLMFFAIAALQRRRRSRAEELPSE